MIRMEGKLEGKFPQIDARFLKPDSFTSPVKQAFFSATNYFIDHNLFEDFKNVFICFDQVMLRTYNLNVLYLKIVLERKLDFLAFFIKRNVCITLEEVDQSFQQGNDYYIKAAPIWFIAIEHNFLDVIEVFKKHDCDFSIKGIKECKKGQYVKGNALHIACYYGNAELIRFFGMDKRVAKTVNELGCFFYNNEFDQFGNRDLSPILANCIGPGPSVETMQALIDIGADFTNVDKLGKSIMHLTVIYGLAMCVEFIVQKFPPTMLSKASSDGVVPKQIIDLLGTNGRQYQTKYQRSYFEERPEEFNDWKVKKVILTAMSDYATKQLLDQEESEAQKQLKKKEQQKIKKEKEKLRKQKKKLLNLVDQLNIQNDTLTFDVDKITVFQGDKFYQENVKEFLNEGEKTEDLAKNNLSSNLTSQGLAMLDCCVNKLDDDISNYDRESCFDNQSMLDAQESKESMSTYEESQLDPNSDEEFDNFSDQQSVQTTLTSQSLQSILTVHSKNSFQKTNEHWQTRANDRGGLDVADPSLKKLLLNQLKYELNHGGANVRISQRDENRVIVTTKDSGLHFILAKVMKKVSEKRVVGSKECKDKKAKKQVYVPVTVLAPDMEEIIL